MGKNFVENLKLVLYFLAIFGSVYALLILVSVL